jgi:hypothetical protein
MINMILFTELSQLLWLSCLLHVNFKYFHAIGYSFIISGLVKELDLHKYDNANKYLNSHETYILVQKEMLQDNLSVDSGSQIDSKSFQYTPLLFMSKCKVEYSLVSIYTHIFSYWLTTKRKKTERETMVNQTLKLIRKSKLSLLQAPGVIDVLVSFPNSRVDAKGHSREHLKSWTWWAVTLYIQVKIICTIH